MSANTNRPSNEQSAIERATLDVVHDLNSAISHEWKANGVPVPEKEFRRIIAGYLFNRTERDLHEMLGIDPPTHTHHTETD